MRIGLVSDTRIPGTATEVPPQVARAFDGVDLILHAGGIQAARVLDWLEGIAPVKAVGRLQGRQFESSTPFTMETSDNRVAEQQVFQIEGHTICALGDAAAWPIQGLMRHFRGSSGCRF